MHLFTAQLDRIRYYCDILETCDDYYRLKERETNQLSTNNSS